MVVIFDVVKALDTMDWRFIARVLGVFGFEGKFIGWIRKILESARLSVVINSSPHGYFSCVRVVHQGVPLSALLSYIMEHVLSRGILWLRKKGLLIYTASSRGTTAPSYFFMRMI